MNDSQFLETALAAVSNHLWQTTLFALLAWPLAWLLRGNRAKTRYWLWMIASLKFLLPFSLFFWAGNALRKVIAPPMHAVALPRAMENFSAPVAAGASLHSFDHLATNGKMDALSGSTLALSVLIAIWISGICVILASWFREWRRVRALVLHASYRSSIDGIPIALVSGVSEPGVFGIFGPVLLLPEKLSDQLSTEQLSMIFAHELCHIRRRDNLTAVLYMSVAVIFWFDPMVWWIKNRLLEERERACDEYVLAAGNDAEQYAQGILNVCKCCLASPLPCVSGVTGSDLKKRIVRIMHGSFAREMGPAKRALLIAVSLIAIAAPIAVGLLHAPLKKVSAAAEPLPSFEVISIRPDPKVTSMSSGVSQAAFDTKGSPLKLLVQDAFSLKNFQILNAPGWVSSERYTIHARLPEEVSKLPDEERYKQVGPMLQSMLIDRFHLRYHWTTQTVPVYSLVTIKAGTKMPLASPEEKYSLMVGNNEYDAHAITMADFTENLGLNLDRIVQDRTGLTGAYTFKLAFPPTSDASPTGVSPSSQVESEARLFSALQDQLGLKLVMEKRPVQMLVIDDIQRPTPN